MTLCLFAAAGGYAAWLVYNSPIVKITALWALGALAVYWFATSGGMYNIIRGIPLYYRGQNGKLVWWMEVRLCHPSSMLELVHACVPACVLPCLPARQPHGWPLGKKQQPFWPHVWRQACMMMSSRS
jgi:hypothetical protein